MDNDQTRQTAPALIRRAAIALAIAALSGSIGCAGSIPPPAKSASRFGAFPASLDASGREYVLVIQAPSAGYVPSLSRVLPNDGRSEAFVTLRRPNASYAYTQAVVEQRVAIPVPTSGPLWAYLRLVASDAPADDETPFELAATNPKP